MIDWPRLMMRAGRLNHYDTQAWIARRINKKLAGYEAMKKRAKRLHNRYGHCPDGNLAGIDEGACRIMQSAKEAEADYENSH